MNREEAKKKLIELQESNITRIIDDYIIDAIGDGSPYVDVLISAGGPITDQNQYYITNRLAGLGYDIELSKTLDTVRISWF